MIPPPPVPLTVHDTKTVLRATAPMSIGEPVDRAQVGACRRLSPTRVACRVRTVTKSSDGTETCRWRSMVARHATGPLTVRPGAIACLIDALPD